MSSRAGAQDRPRDRQLEEGEASTSARSGQKACWRCGTTDRRSRKCSLCKTARYCGEKCQKEDWPGHKARCDEIIACSNAHLMALPMALADALGHWGIRADESSQKAPSNPDAAPHRPILVPGLEVVVTEQGRVAVAPCVPLDMFTSLDMHWLVHQLDPTSSIFPHGLADHLDGFDNIQELETVEPNDLLGVPWTWADRPASNFTRHLMQTRGHETVARMLNQVAIWCRRKPHLLGLLQTMPPGEWLSARLDEAQRERRDPEEA